MTSLRLQKGTYIYGDEDGDDDAATTSYETQRQRQATVYDAVAGRVSLKFAKDSAASGSRKTSSGYHQLADPVLAPEEALFLRKHAPQRYAERDIYFAHQNLPQNGRNLLPDSDMLKAVHRYTSHFYQGLAQQTDSRCVDERSMDETALLAFGILLEEAAKESLGENGDLVFTEGMEEIDGQEHQGNHSKQPRGQTEAQTEAGAGVTASQQPPASPIGFQDREQFWRRKYAKRRKIDEQGD